LGIPRLAFCGFRGFSSLNELITIPGFPTPLELAKAKCPASIPVPGMEQTREKIYQEELRCDGVALNSFKELETFHIESFEQMTRKKVWTVGPMCLCHQNINTMAPRGNNASIDEAECLQWLHSMKPGSVIF
ncbi:hypothetical protein ZWY2020_057625, partial [Hordeum vulgare]